MSAPATTRMRRPFRSPMRPAIGCERRIIGLTAPIASATPKLPAPRSSFDVHGQDHEQHPDRHAGRELREDREDERLRQDAIGLHVPIQPEPGTPTRIGGRADGAERARDEIRGPKRGGVGGRRRRRPARGSRSPQPAGGVGAHGAPLVVVARARGAGPRALRRPVARRETRRFRRNASRGDRRCSG